jgi:hypothetical protein
MKAQLTDEIDACCRGMEEARKAFVVLEIEDTGLPGYGYCFVVHLLTDKWRNKGRAVSTS